MGLSEYELERLENIRQNQAFLSSINLFKVGLNTYLSYGLLNSNCMVFKLFNQRQKNYNKSILEDEVSMFDLSLWVLPRQLQHKKKKREDSD